jgi:hypothetical protein
MAFITIQEIIWLPVEVEEPRSGFPFLTSSSLVLSLSQDDSLLRLPNGYLPWSLSLGQERVFFSINLYGKHVLLSLRRSQELAVMCLTLSLLSAYS